MSFCKMALGFGLALLGIGCAAPAEVEEESNTESNIVAEMQNGSASEYPEAVMILANNTAQDYCTGVLVSPTRVLTAAHCMAARTFQVIAPNAPGRPSSAATNGGAVAHSRNFNEEVEKEDAAILVLSTPIQLSSYPELRDVGALGTRTVRGVAVGRIREERNAGLVKSKTLTIRGGEEEGYTTGVSSEFYSSGGDSGGPLFLAQPLANGRHVLIGVERQPDGESDRFTRMTQRVRTLAGH